MAPGVNTTSAALPVAFAKDGATRARCYQYGVQDAESLRKPRKERESRKYYSKNGLLRYWLGMPRCQDAHCGPSGNRRRKMIGQPRQLQPDEMIQRAGRAGTSDGPATHTLLCQGTSGIVCWNDGGAVSGEMNRPGAPVTAAESQSSVGPGMRPISVWILQKLGCHKIMACPGPRLGESRKTSFPPCWAVGNRTVPEQTGRSPRGVPVVTVYAADHRVYYAVG